MFLLSLGFLAIGCAISPPGAFPKDSLNNTLTGEGLSPSDSFLFSPTKMSIFGFLFFGDHSFGSVDVSISLASFFWPKKNNRFFVSSFDRFSAELADTTRFWMDLANSESFASPGSSLVTSDWLFLADFRVLFSLFDYFLFYFIQKF